MMNTKLWGTSVKGNVYALSTNSTEWYQIENQKTSVQGFKKVVGWSVGVWGLGCDHQLYVYVEGSDVPIRVQEVTNENERWIPTQGWSRKHLLPVDPFGWSNEDGAVHIAKEDIKLPSTSWEWETEWKIDENINGHITDEQGWRYSDLDFNHSFSHKKSFRSCVRRRRWIRYRRYTAFNKWTKLASLHIDPLQDPIVDVSLGGQDLQNQQEGGVGVWIVTIDGKLLFRSGVCQQCPEGCSFAQIDQEEDHEVVCVSAGRRNLVWALTWHGAILARNGVTWQNLKGIDWSLIPFPEGLGKQDKVVQVAVGSYAAWVVSTEGKVWLRKGITADCVHGTGWLQMVNTMKSVTLSGQDKVFGIDIEDRQLYFRSGITSEEQSGRSWQVIDLPFTTVKHHTNSVSSYLADDNSKTDYEQSIKDDAESTVMSDLPVYKAGLIPSSSGTAIPDISLTSNDEYFLADETMNLSLKGISENIEDKFEDSFMSAKSDINDNDNILNLEDVDLDDKTEPVPSQFGCLSFDMGDGRDIKKEEISKQSKVNRVEITTETPDSKVKVNENVDVVWNANLKTEGANENAPSRFVSFKRLKSSIGGKIKTPIDVIQKIKSSKPKEVFSDLKKDIVDQKKEVLNKTSQAVSIFRHGKQSEMDKAFTVSYKKAEAGQAMQLKFVDKDTEETESCKSEGADSGLSLQSSITAQSQQKISRPSQSSDTLSLDNYSDTTSLLDDDLSSYASLPTETDIGEIQWAWISAEACDVLDDTKIKHWLCKDKGSVLSSLYHKHVSQASWRNCVLDKLKQRNSAYCKKFQHYELAIEKAGWSKTGNIRWWQDVHKGQKWLPCVIELTQDSESANSSFTCTYTWKDREEHIYIDLKDVLCIQCEKEEGAGPPVFCIHTTDRINTQPPTLPYRFTTDREEEMEDWVSSINGSLCDLQGVQGSPAPCSVWSLSERGDVFVHEPAGDVQSQMLGQMFWHQFGGHLKIIESNCVGVTWGIGHNGAAFIYTGGYGGGFFKGVSSSPYGIYQMADLHEMYVYENQRWRLGRGYTDKAKLVSHFMWSDETGHKEVTKESVKLPSYHWSWLGDWVVDYKTPGGVDKQGWQYATGKSFKRQFYPHPKINSYLRRRRWVRKCKVTTSGPWEEIGPLSLIDISIQSDPDDNSPDPSIAVWAIGQNGDMLCRAGVTKSNFKGSGWLHISSDQVFISVSIGLQCRIWALTKDGGVWCRQGVTSQCTIGIKWEHVEPPPNCCLQQISAGKNRICVVDKECVLWCRTAVTDDCPLGKDWVKIHTSVRQVSVGPKDQVWLIRDKCESKMGTINGVLSRRIGIPDNDVSQGSWDTGLTGGWMYVCARGWLN